MSNQELFIAQVKHLVELWEQYTYSNDAVYLRTLRTRLHEYQARELIHG